MTTGHGEKLTRKQEQSIACLLSCPTVEAAAEKVGVSATTLKHWLARPEFRKAYRQARVSVLEGTVGRLVQATTKAVEVLEEGLQSAKMSDRLRAAQIILTFAHKGCETVDVPAQLEELKAELETHHATQTNNGVFPQRATG